MPGTSLGTVLSSIGVPRLLGPSSFSPGQKSFRVSSRNESPAYVSDRRIGKHDKHRLEEERSLVVKQLRGHVEH